MRERITRAAFVAAALAMAVSASAQIPFTKLNNDNTAANAAFALQNPNGPAGTNYQVNYPYPGQCLAGTQNGLFPTLGACPAGNSFACPDTAAYPGVSNQSAGGWSACGAPFGFAVLPPMIPNSVPLATNPVTPPTPKFRWEVLNPFDYTPSTKYAGADYYEIGLHEAWGFQVAADLGAFPNPKAWATTPGQYPDVPNGMQWTGITCNKPLGCTCPAGLAQPFKNQYCSIGPGTAIPANAPLYTPIWGVGQIPAVRGALTSPWSANDYLATWPSVSIRGTKGRPVVVKWTNEFPNSHVLCPHPDAADWPCAIDRTFMGVKARIDPAAATGMSVPAEGVNAFGSPQQPDNSWVTHLHGGEVPPSTDGFAEKWFGNSVTGPLYTPAGGKLINPPFEAPLSSRIELMRPAGNSDTYAYPMVQEEATIWFHDHTLGKTHHNVIAGPAGFFPVKEPKKHGALSAWVPPVAAPAPATPYMPNGLDYAWLDPVTEPRMPLGTSTIPVPRYDLFLAIQDRAFNEDGSINFSTGLGQPIPPPPAILPIGYTPVTNGVNPQVHPTWVPEYFGDVALVNGVAWPVKSTEPGWYRLRIVDGSDSRCWTIGFQQSALAPSAGAKVNYNVPFYVIANDQGYLQNPVLAPKNQLTTCPGERYELLVNFGALPGVPVGGPAKVWMVNNAPAPFPAGISPQALASPYAELNVIMGFDVNALFGPGIKSCGQTVKAGKVVTAIAPWGLTQTTDWTTAGNANLAVCPTGGCAPTGYPAPAPLNIPAGSYANICMPANPAVMTDAGFVNIRPAALPQPAAPITLPQGTVLRQVYLNERVDGVTLTPLGMQLNGVPFEYKVTETPKLNSTEIWQFVNLTVDAHPMHPHLVRHLVVARQNFNVGRYKAALCGSTTCQPGTAPGGEMQVVPDVTPFLTGNPVFVGPTSVESGYKDATQAPPGQVTTIVAEWTPRWPTGATITAPGACTTSCPLTVDGTGQFVYESVTTGPYVWHCHINSHEDSEMMRTSLVVAP